MTKTAQRAKELGATYSRDCEYPRSRNQYDFSEKGNGLFARYYFNAAGNEVGYYLFCTDSFVEHPQPRVWHPGFLCALSNRRTLL